MGLSVRVRVWAETAFASLGSVSVVLTLVWPDWIETVFHVDPDGGKGGVEWLVAGTLLAVAVTSALLARRDGRRLAAATSG
jgi:hypothetical protein